VYTVNVMDEDGLLYSLLVTVAVSEVLPLLQISPNGITHALFLGLRRVVNAALKHAEKQTASAKYVGPKALSSFRFGDQACTDEERQNQTTEIGGR